MPSSRDLSIARAWMAGESGPDLASMYGVSRQRISQIIRRLQLPKRQLRSLGLRRFWGYVSINPEGCWEWTGQRARFGYGRAAHLFGTHLAHRISWTLANGPIPKGLFVCHHCDNPPCVRPDHLFLGTASDNIRDAWAKGRMRPGGLKAPKTHCVNGHPLPTNLNDRKNGCKVCRTIRDRRRPDRGRRAA